MLLCKQNTSQQLWTHCVGVLVNIFIQVLLCLSCMWSLIHIFQRCSFLCEGKSIAFKGKTGSFAVGESNESPEILNLKSVLYDL